MQLTTMNADRAMCGYALANNEGEAFWLLGMLQTVKIGRADTSGGYGLIEVVVPAGLGSPWHVHPEEDEWFYVLEGNLIVYVGNTRLDLAAGGFAFGPKGYPIRLLVPVLIPLGCWWVFHRCSSRDSCGKWVSSHRCTYFRHHRTVRLLPLRSLLQSQNAMGSSFSVLPDLRRRQALDGPLNSASLSKRNSYL
jgi:mannose-6-phosphate isomerase-like protein (cupin superfamily)